jgi:hypothetical protein
VRSSLVPRRFIQQRRVVKMSITKWDNRDPFDDPIEDEDVPDEDRPY